MVELGLVEQVVGNLKAFRIKVIAQKDAHGAPHRLDPRLIVAARDRGIEQPYTHQAQAIEATLAGEHVVLSTSTASGKTLAYNLPVLNTLLNDPHACALYLFPTKALAYDQLANLQSQIPNLKPPIAVRPYDGDTPSSHRSAIRREARLLIFAISALSIIQ